MRTVWAARQSPGPRLHLLALWSQANHLLMPLHALPLPVVTEQFGYALHPDHAALSTQVVLLLCVCLLTR